MKSIRDTVDLKSYKAIACVKGPKKKESCRKEYQDARAFALVSFSEGAL